MRQHLPLIILSVIGVGLIVVLALDVAERRRTNRLIEHETRRTDQALSDMHDALVAMGGRPYGASDGQPIPPAPPPPDAWPPDTTSAGPPTVIDADAPDSSDAPDGPAVDLPPADRWDRVSDVVTAIVTELLDGQYDTVVGRFDPPTARVLNRDELASIIDPIRSAKGRFARIVSHRPTRTDLPPNLYACRVEVETDKGHIVVVTLTLDSQNRIAQLYVD